jgi:hypothetical protein
MVLAGLLGLMVAFWRQIVFGLIVLSVVALATRAVMLPWDSYYDRKVVVSNVFTTANAFGQTLHFTVRNDTPKQQIRLIRFECSRFGNSTPFIKVVNPGETVEGEVRFYGEGRIENPSACRKSFEMMRVL